MQILKRLRIREFQEVHIESESTPARDSDVTYIFKLLHPRLSAIGDVERKFFIPTNLKNS